MKTFNYKDGTVEEFLKDSQAFQKFISSIDSERLLNTKWILCNGRKISKVKESDSFYIKPTLRNRIPFSISFIEIKYGDRTKETYFLPMAFSKNKEYENLSFMRIRTKEGFYYSIDGISYPHFIKFLTESISSNIVLRGKTGSLSFENVPHKDDPICEPINSDSRHSYARCMTKSVYKIRRNIEEGINVEYEIGDFLNQNAFEFTPKIEGCINYISRKSELSTVGIRFSEVDSQGHLWDFVLNDLRSYVKDKDKKNKVNDQCLEVVEKLAQTLALMHSALRKDKKHPRFHPEKIDENFLNDWEDSFVHLAKTAVDSAQGHVLEHPENSQKLGGLNITIDVINKIFEIAKKCKDIGERTRIHGNLDLTRIIMNKKNLYVVGFEKTPVEYCKKDLIKFSPLKDLSTLLRSFHYVSSFVAKELKYDKDLNAAEAARGWYKEVSKHFVSSYLEWARKTRCASVPYSDKHAVDVFVTIFSLGRALCELLYEIKYRPDWVDIPALGIEELLDKIMTMN